VLPEGASEAQAELEAERARQEEAAKNGTARGTMGAKTLKAGMAGQEVMKIYLRNDSYKTILVAPSDTARTLCASMAKKLGIEELTGHFDLISLTKDDGTPLSRSLLRWR
jgi:hypothetical protein